MLIKILTVLFLITCVASEKFRFDNYTLYKVFPKSAQQLAVVQDLENDLRYDFWTDPGPNVEFVNIMAAPGDKFDFESYLTRHGVNFEIALPNIQDVIDKETVKKYTKNNLRSMEWDAYYTFEEIYAWLDDLVAAYPDIVTMINIGKSYEGRDIKGIKISHGPGRRSIFLEGGIHSREWITHATVNFITNELLTSDDEETKAAAHDFDWYIFPITNPDGYVWTHVGYRLWRKNRQPYGTEIGVDLNRNWNNNWLVVGASTDPAFNTYAGPGPFSEPETRVLSTFLRSIGSTMDMYLSFHSSGQLLLIPFGNTTEPLANYYDAVNHASGNAVDWVKEDLHVPLVYCYELRDRGTYGHLLPADQILPNSLETMDSINVHLTICMTLCRSNTLTTSDFVNILITLIMLILVASVPAEKFRFDNYTLYKILPQNDVQMKLLQSVQDNDMRYDFWTNPVPSAEFVIVMSSPEHKSDLENILNRNDVKYEVTMSNIQEAIDKEVVKTYTRGDIRSMQWDAYYTMEQINAWIDDLAAAYPDIVTVIIGGESYEGHQIKGLKISHGEGKRIIFLEGGIHSREWISPSAVNYITNELLTSDDEETKAAARDFDWYIFPVTNPDGYIWSHTSFRMWRKNRRPIRNNFGVDLNRNWNNNWLVSGASINPALDTYAGPGPFSEPETRSLSTYIRSISDRIDMYLSFHSFSQMLLLPFGNTTAPLANYDEAINIGRRAMGALSVRYGTEYVTGNVAETIYMATGGSIDWVKEHLNVPLVYCYELRDKGQFGFLLPTEQILPNNQETMDSVLDLIHQAKRFGVMSGVNGMQASAFLIGLAIIVRFL
ncbi:hypothetical protein K1T71_010649 [Dendrolimus kikuchii]|uniref:Uncharacterized protein n=1 Tax=Dendrolimus kikuchii TaxID=765133 RepID=A0ACC1CPQ6_9NEOP|nr:hypothetical protein K1T71_010649 [Dendrolimus kikuchii]